MQTKLSNCTRKEFNARVEEIRRRQLNPPTPEEIAEKKAEAERQQKETTEAGEKLGWKPEHIIKYTRALARWIKAGRPTRTDEEVATIVAVCKGCDKYVVDKKRCSVCGCGVSTGGLAIFNKARLEMERCPKDKW